MLSNIYREIANGFYFVSSQVEQYKLKNNNVHVLAAGATKARKFEKDEDIKSDFGWATARRAALILTSEKLVCGTWEILLSDIKEAKLLRIKSIFAKAFVLKVSTNQGESYQFGLQYDPAWENQTSFKLIIEDGKVKRSIIFSIIRIIFWLYLIGLCISSFWLTYKDLLNNS